MEPEAETAGLAVTSVEMPRYRCHKEVHALKIKSIHLTTPDKPAILVFEGGLYKGLRVPLEWFNRHKPEVGGYYVVYKDGYTSYSPAQAFEEGYTRI